ncbi:acyltransferase [Cupriavidus sp.]|jgi:peptidoglycan/LPS O-acetylase OafA/YrhL|uniref:acyltransferase family protein n=1 Tax=Cupriavidus sp. TaxID=1873897 RepID=UPI0028BE76B0|nr:acyltransferase [Cupriavidus sp.]
MGFFRLLLAIAVVVAHSSPLFGLEFTGGVVAVQAFYIVSGFYISLILNEKYGPGLAGTKLFYSNRFLRIYPIYWTILAASIALSILELSHPNVHTIGTLRNFTHYFDDLGFGSKLYLLITNISLIGMDWGFFLRLDGPQIEATTSFLSFHPRAFELAFVPQAWTLGIEIAVYLIAPFIFRRKLAVLVAMAAASTAARAYAFSIGLTEDPWSYRFLPFELGLFILGAIAYRAYKEVSFLSRKSVGWLCLTTVLTLTVYYPHLSTAPSVIPGFYTGQLLFLLAVFISIPAMFHLSKSSRVDRWIGELSYPVYLSQMMVIPLFSGAFGPGNIYPVIGSLAISVLVVLVIDRPIEKFRQARVKNAGSATKESQPGLRRPQQVHN